MGRREARRAEASTRAGTRGSRAAAAAVCLGLCVVATALGSTALRVALQEGSTAAPESTSLVAAAVDEQPGSAPSADATASSGERSSAISAAVVPAPAAVALASAPAPLTLRVPSLDVSSSLVRLGVTAEGTLEVPTDAAVAGWFDEGPAPGAVGPAVIAGHVDSRRGPGVFARLRSVAVGAEVDVDREDGSTARFVVTAVRQVAKDAFPTEEVYGPVTGPELRLITCGGVFDESTGHYVDNVVVFATAA